MMKIILLALFVPLATDGTKGQCGRDYSLFFSKRDTTDYVAVEGMPSLEAITACLWMRSDYKLSGNDMLVIFSYANTNSDNEFLVEKYQTRLKLLIGGQGVSAPETSANDGHWHHVCATWESSAGSWNMYMDGERIGGGSGLKVGRNIASGGLLVLGQEQDSVGGGFNPAQSFVGDLSGPNVWNRVLTGPEISDLSESCHAAYGNVFKWSDFRNNRHGYAQIIQPSVCYVQ